MAATGLIDIALLTPVQGSLRLLATAAESWSWVASEVHRRYGWTPLLTDAYRDYQRQVELFTQRYTTAKVTYASGLTDRRWWDGKWWYRRPNMQAAAVPGTSNHGRADTVDVADLGGFGTERFDQFAAVATEAGWDNTEGRAVSEYWHWRHFPGRDHHVAAPAPIPQSTVSEEDDMFDAPTIIADAYKVELGREGNFEKELWPRIRRVLASADPRAQLAAEVHDIDVSPESNRYDVHQLYRTLLYRDGSPTDWDNWLKWAGLQPGSAPTAAQLAKIESGIKTTDEYKKLHPQG